MRSIRYSVAMSADGYVAGPRGEIDWIVMDPDIDFAAFFSRFDTMVMGRATYEFARRMGRGVAMPGMTAYVCSRTLDSRDCPDVVVSRDAAATIAELRKKPGKDILLFGGSALFRSLLALRLVDSIRVAVVPVLLGDGLPFLSDAERARLKLTSHRVYPKTGIVALEYEIA